ncbi:sigma factor-like helix-turn-helix DNA-binding protein [Streptomyces sp. NPDC056112]|uniref:sigma factor-like helix-turn-helix DNA-binding protein n=1 Tax=Streptomyces sp. NPDC056112 TaxID=3345715 RepID=UPI0035DBB76A
MTASRAAQAIASDRRAQMLRMKVQGRSVSEIAAHFEMSPGTVRKDISRAVRKAKDLEIQEAELYRQLQATRLETLLGAVWPEASAGDVKASEQARKLVADLTDLMGVKIPVRTEISGPDGGAIPFNSGETAELLALIGISDQEHAEIPVIDHDALDDEEEEDGQDDNEDDDDDSA